VVKDCSECFRRWVGLVRRWLGAVCVLVAFLSLIVYPLLVLWRLVNQRPPKPSRFAAPVAPECQLIPPHIYNRPDPMIYSQRYLLSEGLAVTWENPDVQIEQSGTVVDPASLAPGTTYDVIARIWNGSVDAPAVGLPVRFSYLSFGVGTEQHPIGVTTVNLGAKGAPGCPAFAQQSWTTPPTPGHYCLLIELVWSDDANPANNIGQSNTDVKALNSPHAEFEFEATNLDQRRHEYSFRLDTYALPSLAPCDRQPPARTPVPGAEEIKARMDLVRRQNAPSAFPIPPGWTVTVNPEQLELAPGETAEVTVDVTAPDGFVGRQPFNVNTFDDQGNLIGGVTLTVHS
jgi:hypothetical protein